MEGFQGKCPAILFCKGSKFKISNFFCQYHYILEHLWGGSQLWKMGQVWGIHKPFRIVTEF